MWWMMAALAAPPGLEAAAYGEAVAQCEAGDAAVCGALADLALDQWLGTLWVDAVGAGSAAPSWRAAMRLFEQARHCAEGGRHCELVWGQEAYPFRELVLPLSPFCTPHDDADCVTPSAAVPVDTLKHRLPFPFGDGWATVAHGRVYPRDDRPDLLIAGASAGWGDASSWVFTPTRAGRSHTSSWVSVLSPTGWIDKELDLDGEGICYAPTGLVVISHEGSCSGALRTLRLEADGTVHPLPGQTLDVAGDYILTQSPARDALRLYDDGQLVWERSVRSVRQAVVSTDGRVAYEVFQRWTVVDDDEDVVFEAAGSSGADWAGDTLYVLHHTTLVARNEAGAMTAAWRLPWSARALQVHPAGHSFRVLRNDRDEGPYADIGQVFSFGDAVPPAELPDWLTSAEAHRLPWPAPPSGEPGRVLLGGEPVEGAFVQGQYTDAEGRFVRTGRVERVWVDGLARPWKPGAEAGDVELRRLRMTQLPSGRSATLSRSSGAPLRVGVDLGDGVFGVVDPDGAASALVDDALLSVDAEDLSWTSWPRVTLTVVDEVGRPMSGILVAHDREVPGHDRGLVGVDGQVSVRDVDAPLLYRGQAGRREGDRVVFSRPPLTEALGPLGPPVEPVELAGRWSPITADGVGEEELLLVPRAGMGRRGRVITERVHSPTWLLPLDGERLVQVKGATAPYDGNVYVDAFVRHTVPERPRRTTGKQFVGRFGWAPGDRIQRVVGGEVVDEAEVDTVDEALRVRWTLKATGGAFPGARTLYLAPTGWFLGVDPDDHDAFREQMADVLSASGRASMQRQAHFLLQPLGGDRWSTLAEQSWFTEIGALVGRALTRDQPQVVTMRAFDADDGAERVELTYLGLESCSVGRCAHVRIRRGEGDDEKHVELWVERDTLRPVRRVVTDGVEVREEAWRWE